MKADAQIEMAVPFVDVDSMGIVWHGHYVKYFELARCELLNQIGFGYTAMHTSPFSWPVIDMKLRYVQPVKFEQKIQIAAQFIDWDVRLKIGYLITDAVTNARLTKGHSVQVAVNRENHELQFGLPDIMSRKIDQWVKTHR